jgi:small-conductance mechanosensitive channel
VEAIPAAQVAARATEVTNLLVDLTAKAAAQTEIENILPRFFQLRHTIAGEIDDTERALAGQPSIERLQGLRGEWQPWKDQTTGWLEMLTKRSIELQQALDQLSRHQSQWTLTRNIAHTSDIPGATLDQIETVLNAIAAAQIALRTRHEHLLNLQSRIAETAKECGEMLTRITDLQRGAVVGILSRGNRPIWSPQIWEATRTELSGRFIEVVETFRTDWGQYGRRPANEMPLHIVLLLVTAVLFMIARHRLKYLEVSGEKEETLVAVFEQPLAAALYITWFVATRYDSPTPPMVRETLSVMAIVPILWLVRPVIPPRLMPGIYGLGALYGLDILRGVLSGTAGIEQVLLVVEGLAGVAILLRLISSGALENIVIRPSEQKRHPLDTFARGIAVTLILGVLATASGYMRLGRIVTAGILFSFALALALYAGVRVYGGIAALCLRLWPLRHLQMVQRKSAFLEKWIYRILLALAALSWAVRLLEHLGLLNPVQSVIGAFLGTRLERGTISISVEDILAFVAAVAVAAILSRLIRFALKEEVYPRAHVPSGSAYAVSRLLHYSIIALGFVVGLGLLGMDLTRVSVLAGALGVGIGFGLQSVVNNFVSGLILLFERPVHVGDAVEVSGLYGEVQHIGIRASTVRTRQGSDIIIPNAEFITANVTNWTLSDRLRRIEVPVGVNYGSHPKKVIQLLEEVARAQPQILARPAPRCLFLEYGDSAINFELRCWTDQPINYNRIRSHLNTAVYDAVKAAGMSFPFPQREVRLLDDTRSTSSGIDQAENVDTQKAGFSSGETPKDKER